MTGYSGSPVAQFVSSSTANPPTPDFAMDTSGLTVNSHKYLMVCNKPGKYRISFTGNANVPSTYLNLYKSSGANNVFAIDRMTFSCYDPSYYATNPFNSIVDFTISGQKFWFGQTSNSVEHFMTSLLIEEVAVDVSVAV
jgi:hypothetical protein